MPPPERITLLARARDRQSARRIATRAHHAHTAVRVAMANLGVERGVENVA